MPCFFVYLNNQIMKLKKATRMQARMRLGLQGPAGSGKTYGALLIAFGLCGDWTKVAVIDSENNSSCLYAHLGPFNTLSLYPPYTPEVYIDAILECQREGIEVIIIDSLSHLWDGAGGVLDIHNSLAGNSFTNWAKITPRFNACIQTMLNNDMHLIATLRSKQDYVLSDKNGKMVPEKVGLKAVQREGLDYEFTTLFELDIKHNAIATKDRTSLFAGKPEFKLIPVIGERIREWCNQGEVKESMCEVMKRIERTASISELLELYQSIPSFQQLLHASFAERRKQLEIKAGVYQIIQQEKITSNGNNNHQDQ
jgi:hypothetical protein